MKIYLVGGAVRDMLLGKTPKDKDYVVVGATADDMIKLGFKQVGKDFPVFLHPETGEEYALARVERKTGSGYDGFSFDVVNVSLEDDLKRRDLTINSMAIDLETNEIIDPFNGQKDLKNGTLRHTSDAFFEDPVRVLRLARFHARYGFAIDDSTICHIQNFDKKELMTLDSDRLREELIKVSSEENPLLFFTILSKMNVLSVIFPDILLNDFVKDILMRADFKGDHFLSILLLKSDAEKMFSKKLISSGVFKMSVLFQDMDKICDFLNNSDKEEIVKFIERNRLTQDEVFFNEIIPVISFFCNVNVLIKSVELLKEIRINIKEGTQNVKKYVFELKVNYLKENLD